MNRVTETWTIQMVTNTGDVSAREIGDYKKALAKLNEMIEVEEVQRKHKIISVMLTKMEW